MTTLTTRRGVVHAPRSCAVCPQRFTPQWVEQLTCGGRCARRLAGRTLRARGTAPALLEQHAVNRAKRQQAIEATCRDRWTTLSAREREIFAFAEAAGYRRGYALGYQHRRRGKRAEQL